MAALEFEQRVIKAIQAGDLKELKRCCIGKNDVNRPICFSKEIPIISKSNKGPFQVIRSPTLLIYTILCEQDELLKYLLEVKSPNLNARVNGWAPIHYAACTYDHKCLELLLKYEYIQQNIDMAIDEPSGVLVSPGQATTALHVAATNKRHANALLLTQVPLPKIEYHDDGRKVEPDDVFDYYQSSNPLQMTPHGSMPLHIAARQRDWDMCQILLHASDDATVRNMKGQTAADIARHYKFNEIAEKLENPELELDPIEKLKNKYLNVSKKSKQIQRDKKKRKHEDYNESSDYSDYDSDSEDFKESFKELKETVKSLTKMVQQLSAKVAFLEANRNVPDSLKPITPHILVYQTFQCQTCGSSTTNQCPQCKNYYCSTCWPKLSHPCMNQ